MRTIKFDFAWSDTHINHRNILKWRGYTGGREVNNLDPEEVDDLMQQMNQDIETAWNSVVTPDSVVLVLGDILMGPRLEGLPRVDRLNGKKILLPGNHDHCWKGNRKRITESRNWPDLYGEHFDQIIDDGVYEVDGLSELVSISHFPYYGDHTEEQRYESFRPPDYGDWLLHGHVHALWRVNGRMINLGADAWEHPVPVEEIAEIMKSPLMFIPSPTPNPLSGLD